MAGRRATQLRVQPTNDAFHVSLRQRPIARVSRIRQALPRPLRRPPVATLSPTMRFGVEDGLTRTITNPIHKLARWAGPESTLTQDEAAYVPDINDVVNDQLNNAADDGNNADYDSQEHPSISPTEAQKMLQTLQLLWMQQEVDSQDFPLSLQRMKDTISKMSVNQMVQKYIPQFFNNS
ncbi:hypothetical protein AXG93_1247s1000 [Marchantia polymorpha subsp. ruderalis]|uniref:Uncharacterized protein n=1 Tax=Marchantia polymorpha subsp. ruderalis TaxID=1480154 RepID=A0A176WN71_MARPO|nr:hypothetical protein AXG93_1247s1000 [Marchantia polymorpha subsp. ruderalis]